MKKKQLLLFLLFLTHLGFAQTYQPIHHYTIENGLPSNLVYNMEQDSLGNLWLATNNGVSRYDGKYFRNFTYKDGLPSNDVVYLKLDAYGVLWLNCFGHKPTYYENDAFHVLKDSTNQITNQNYFLGSTFENEVMYVYGNLTPGEVKQFICKKNKTYEVSTYTFSLHYETRYMGRKIRWVIYKEKGIADVKIFYNGNCTDSIKTKLLFGHPSNIDRGSMIVRIEKTVYEFTLNKQYKIVQRKYEASNIIINACYCGKYFILVDATAQIYIFDRHTTQLLQKLHAPFGAQCAFIDNYEQLWIGTKNNGLFCYGQSKIARYLNDVPNNNFLSVYANKQGTIITGNGVYQTFEINNGKSSQYNYPNTKLGGAIKNILPQLNSIFIIEDKSVLKYKSFNKFSNKNICKKELLVKTGMTINDSNLFLGTSLGAFYLNTLTGKVTIHDIENRTRLYACAMSNNKRIYFTLNDKIYKVQYPSIKKEMVPISLKENEVPISLTCTHDNLLWIATNESRIYVVQQDKIIDTLNEETALLQNLTHITSQGNQIVVSCKTGLAIIDYSFQDKLKYKIRFVTQQDGLPSNVVNQTYIGNDSIYVATENGIGVLPRNFVPNEYSIKPVLQSVRINNELVALQKVYRLKSGAHSISMQVSGLDLSGHLFAMQYSLNDTLLWNTIDGNQLSLILQSGENQIFIRSKDKQNNLGKPVLACIFNVTIPFYQTIWFWVLIVAGVLSFLFWLYNRQQQLKLKQEFDKQLALQNQRKKLTADLHDDIGATLSSLQLNSTIANKFLETNSTKSSDILNTIETQAKELSEKVGDIIWSMNNEDAFGTFSDRIKTYANQILDYTTIDYKINIDNQVDAYISDSIMKKNLILICKETINNAVKYSKANLLIIECNMKADNIHVNIKDNGIGFETKNNKGNGLKNMQQRVAELNGKINIISKLNEGTHIEFIIPTTNRG